MLAFVLMATQADASAVTRELTQIEHRLADTWKKGDCDGWAAMLVQDWSVTHITGSVITKAQAVADCKSAAVPIASFDIDDIAVRVFGDAAVVTGRTTVTTGGASPATVRLRFTDVFSRQSGRWLVVASHATQLK